MEIELLADHSESIPIAFVAAEGGDVYGIAALDLDVATGLTPSVVGLLVDIQSFEVLRRPGGAHSRRQGRHRKAEQRLKNF